MSGKGQEVIELNDSQIGKGKPIYIVAEISANHSQDFEHTCRLIRAAKESGANAIKLQTYTPDTITINCDNPYFRIGAGTLWEGRTLFELYEEAYMPWEWQPKLKMLAEDLGLDFFSTPFDFSAVDFLERMDLSFYKVASFEVVDLPLLRRVAQTNKPIIMSTGMATLAEIEEAMQVIRFEGNEQVALLKCTSAYPAPPEEMNLLTIPHLSDAFCVPVGLSDHTLGISIPVAAVALGACIVEKHLTFSREITGPDSAFSLEPHEFKQMVQAIRETEAALGQVQYEVSERELASRVFRRSLFVVQDIAQGEKFTEENVRSIRPGNGLHTRYLDIVLGRRANKDMQRGSPLAWSLID